MTKILMFLNIKEYGYIKNLNVNITIISGLIIPIGKIV